MCQPQGQNLASVVFALLQRESGTPCHSVSILLPSAENGSGLGSKPTSLCAPTHDSPPRTIEECTYLLTYLLNGLHVDALSVLTASIHVNGASDITSVQTTPPAVKRARMTSWLPEDRYVCRVTFLFTCLAFIRYWRRRRLMFKWTFCVFIFVLFPFFFRCDCSATAGWIFAKCSHQQTSLWCYSLKVKGIGDFVMRQHSDML